MKIFITEEMLDEIVSEIGIPIFDWEDTPYDKEYVKDKFIWKAMREYYRYFPIQNIEEYYISSNFELPFPNEATFNILDARLNTNAPSSGNTMVGTTIKERMLSVAGTGSSSGIGMYGTPYDFGMKETYHTTRAEYNALKNSNSAFRVKVDSNNRVVKGYTNIPGRISIIWAEYSDDYSTIPFEKIEDVHNLARSNIMRAWGHLVKLQSSSTENDLDGDYLIDRADELRTEVIDRWNAITKVVIRRGGR